MAGGYLWPLGSIVVVDQTSGVTSAVIMNSAGAEQRLHKLWPGYFYAVPQIEGAVELRCHNGMRKLSGYVTPHMHTAIQVSGRTPCAKSEDDEACMSR
jgi:hypothetical protein